MSQLQRACHRSVLEYESLPARAAYGYVDMEGWVGGQPEYTMVPYANFNLLKFPDTDEAMEKIRNSYVSIRHSCHRLWQ